MQLLSDFNYGERDGGKYRFVLIEDLVVKVGPVTGGGTHSFYDDDREWLRVRGEKLTIRAGYAWNGCSPKKHVAGRWVGTPDFAGSIMASCIHDALYQFLHLPCFPFKRSECDGIFRAVMKLKGFRLGFVYHGAVAVFGGVNRLLDRNHSGACSTPHPKD